MLKKILLTCFVMFSFVGFSQKSNMNEVINRYTEYFELAPETVFVQLNKTQFLIGEHLWFKAYVYDTKTQKPYLKTTNLYASVFNSKGFLMEQKLFQAQQAMTDGDFEIKANYPPGKYLVKFSTNWMKNFNEDLAVYHTFTILGEENENEIASETKKIKDIQFFPEGGHLISGIMNTVGFKLNDNKGNSVQILSAKILDSKDAVVTQFSSNELGLGKLQITPNANETYSVEAKLLDGSLIKQAFLQPELKGIAVAVNNLNEQQLFLGIATNEMTLPEMLGKDFYLLIHRDGSVKKVDFQFKPDVYQYTLPVSRDILFPGVNILTFFDAEGQPIFERLIYNQNEGLRQSLTLTSMIKGVDSTQIVLKASRPSEATISVSALPMKNETYDTDNNILNSFLLKPYVKGRIDNASYYFKNNDRKTTYDLDLLLLVQGWSKHDWKDIFYSPQQALNDFETGFQIAGKLTDSQKNDLEEIHLFSQKNAIMETSQIDENGYFRFDNLSLNDSTEISFSAKNTKGKMIKPKLYFNIFPKSYQDSISEAQFIQHLPAETITSKTVDYSDFVTDPFEMSNMVSLDTISIKDKKKAPKNKIIFGTLGGRFIDIESQFSSETRVLTVLQFNGFIVSEYGLGGSEITIKSRRPSTSILQESGTPTVYINNMEALSLKEIQFMTLRDVEEIHISKLSSSIGTPNGGGTINIFLKKDFYVKNSNSSNFNSSQINLGFKRTKTYFTPNYDTSNPEMMTKFSAVCWLPSVRADDSGQFILNIPNFNYGDVKLHISGMVADGSLISETVTLEKELNDN